MTLYNCIKKIPFLSLIPSFRCSFELIRLTKSSSNSEWYIKISTWDFYSLPLRHFHLRRPESNFLWRFRCWSKNIPQIFNALLKPCIDRYSLNSWTYFSFIPLRSRGPVGWRRCPVVSIHGSGCLISLNPNRERSEPTLFVFSRCRHSKTSRCLCALLQSQRQHFLCLASMSSAFATTSRGVVIT